jgi:hypothetical protein
MKHLQTYKIFEAKKAIGLNTKQMAFLKKYVQDISPGRWGWDVSYSTDPPIVNVFTSLNTSQYSLRKKINSMQGIHFGKIHKDFILNDIIISTYAGFPQEVGGDFIIGGQSKLNVPLSDFPDVKIGGRFSLDASSVRSLVGCPEEVGSFEAGNLKILDMIGCPKRFTNPASNWRGKKIGIHYRSSSQTLVSLEGIPDDVKLDEIEIINPGFGMPGNGSISPEDLLDGLAEFRKIGSWIPYFIRIREKYPFNEGIGVNAYENSLRMNEYLDSKINPEAVQEFINQNPIEAAVGLKGIWTKLKADPKYSGVKFPELHSKNADLLGDLSDVGLD